MNDEFNTVYLEASKKLDYIVDELGGGQFILRW